MATVADVTQYSGLFKIVYADKVKDLIPDGVKVLKMIDFVSKAEMQGESYRQAVSLNLEHGFTYSNDGSNATLTGAIAGATKQAEVKSTEMILQSTVSLAAISRSQNPQAAFVQATKHVVKNMMLSMAKRLEVQLLYGQVGIGVVQAIAAGVITIEAEEFAPGIWNCAENMKIETRTPAGVLHEVLTITSVNIEARQLTVTNVSGTGTVATDVIHYAGAFGQEFAGLHKIITNTGTLFGLSAAQYNLWKGNTFALPTAGPLSFDAIKSAISLAVNKGLEGKVTALVSTKAWDDLMSDLAALRMYDSSYDSKEAVYGAESIKFHSQNGEVEVVPSIHVKEGYAYIFSPDDFKRVGSSDMTFELPGIGGNYIIPLENSMGYGLRLYSDQALFCEAPGRSTLISNIVNS